MLLYYALLAADMLYSYMCRPSNRCCVYMLLTYALLAADMLYLLLTYCSLCRGEQQLPPPKQRNRMLTYAHVCSRMLAYAHVCSRMLTYADVSREQQLPPPKQRSRMRRQGFARLLQV